MTDAQENVAKLRTSDRISFKRCRRRWGWQSALRQGRRVYENATPLWLGTGVHFALEDYHGYNHFGDPASAFHAYTEACRRTRSLEMPEDWRDAQELAMEMMRYYVDSWLGAAGRDPLPTYYVDGKPQVEVDYEIPLPDELVADSPFDHVVHIGTLDRVAIDEHERLWLVEYKTAKAFRLFHFETDPQVTSYCWAMDCIYDKPIAGVVYQQHKKTVPDHPRILATGQISTNKSQSTTRSMYKRALENLYGKVDKASSAHLDVLNHLAMQEGDEHDQYIRRDRIQRTQHQIEAEGVKILLEAEDMLNPNMPLYPNPTDGCGWCPFRNPCISLDSGTDWEDDLNSLTYDEKEEYHPWRKQLQLPEPHQAKPESKPKRKRKAARKK